MSQWSDPGVEQVADGVHRIPLPLPDDGLRAVNIYLLESPDGLVFVDSGWALDAAREQLEKALRSLHFSLGDIRRFLITHIHRDHYTMAIELRREFGMQVGLGEGEKESVEIAADPGSRWLVHRRRQLAMLGAPDLLPAPDENTPPPMTDTSLWEFPDEWLAGGQQIQVGQRTLTAVATPGHTAGHLVYVDAASSLLFSGDHVLPRITPSISLEAVSPVNPLGDFLSSLALLRAMPDRTLLPAHGPVTASAHARIDELVEHHRVRLEQTESAVAAGFSTPFEVAGQLRWTRREHVFGDMDTFNQVLAVGETDAHLALLAAQGRLVREDREGVRHYRPPRGQVLGGG